MSFGCISAALFPATAGEHPFLLKEAMERPVHAITKDGYAIAWYDWRTEDYHFNRFDRSGEPIGDELAFRLTDSWTNSKYSTGHLFQVRNGFLFIVQLDSVEVWVVRIGEDATLMEPPFRLMEKEELYPVELASGRSGPVMVYPEWYGTFQNWVQPLTESGTYRTVRRPLVPSTIPSVGRDLYTRGMSIAKDGNPAAPLRNLTEEFQIETFEDIDFNLDTDHGLCVLTWGGMGPESWGGYLLELDCKGAD